MLEKKGCCEWTDLIKRKMSQDALTLNPSPQGRGTLNLKRRVGEVFDPLCEEGLLFSFT